MLSAESVVLCDAIEVGSLQLKKSLSVDDVIAQALHGIAKDDARRLVRDALGVAMLRAKCCPKGYPFEASLNYIDSRQTDSFDPYLFLLFGYSLKHSSVSGRDKLARRFDRYFEDLICWSLRRSGFTACVLSEPREERGLPKSLKPALTRIADLFGEPTSIHEDKVKPGDNDLDVDVIASPAVIDRTRPGGLSVLLQCTTSPVERLKLKMMEGFNLFPSVWNNGFFLATSIRGGATPEDLLTLDAVDWSRLSQTGWVLDRMRVVELFRLGVIQGLEEPQTVLSLWKDLKAALADFDWRNEWREAHA
ncbi:MAG: hypothetical protein ACRENG_20040 [bacterium]